jgi:hypothetical protein
MVVVVVGLSVFQVVRMQMAPPLVLIPQAAGAGVLDPMTITRDYARAVGDAFLSRLLWFERGRRKAALQSALPFLLPEQRPALVAAVGADLGLSGAVGEAQRYEVLQSSIYDFDPDVGASLVYTVKIRRWYNGIAAPEAQYRVTMGLILDPPQTRFPYVLKVRSFLMQQL